MNYEVEINWESKEFKDSYSQTLKEIYSSLKLRLKDTKETINLEHLKLQKLEKEKNDKNRNLDLLKNEDYFYHPILKIKNKKSILDKINILNNEIKEFNQLVKKVKKQVKPRINSLIDNIKLIINKKFPNLKIGIFGSLANKLNLPWSDIDIIVYFENKSVKELDFLQELYSYLKVF